MKKTRCNIYLSQGELTLALGAIDAMLEALPTGADVPEVDAVHADADRASYVLFREKLRRYLNE